MYSYGFQVIGSVTTAGGCVRCRDGPERFKRNPYHRVLGRHRRPRNGFMRGKQRYRCKACGLNVTDTPPRGLPLKTKVTAVLLYLSGLSMNRTAKLLGVSTPGVMAWIERFAEAYAQKPEPEGCAVVIELDEMGHDLQKSPTSSGCGRLGIVLQDVPSIGSWAVVTGPPAPG